MKLFELQSNEPVITAEALLIPVFAVIWRRDKSKNKDIATKELAYVYFSTDYKSLYLGKEDKEGRLKKEIIGNINWIPNKEVLEAIEVYKYLQNTPTMKFLESNQKVMESIGEYFNNVDWDKLDGSGKRPKYDITKVANAVKQAGGIIDNIEKLKAKVAKEQSMNTNTARGKSEGGDLEFE